MNEDWTITAQKVTTAKSVEDVFGKLEGRDAEEQYKFLKKLYHRLAGLLHPDAHATESPGDQKKAEAAFKSLGDWWQKASEAVRRGEYSVDGHPQVLIPLEGGKYHFEVGPEFTRGDKSTIWWAKSQLKTARKSDLALLKIGDARDSDLLAQEAWAIQYLQAQAGQEFTHYLPQMLESFTIKQSERSLIQQVNTFAFRPGYYSLIEVRSVYPNGVDVRDAAWMFNRLLSVLGLAHCLGIVHGAVLPPHILIDPENHDLMLVDWGYSVGNPEKRAVNIPAIASEEFLFWYPPEVTRKEPATPAVDIMMATECLFYLLGGDPLAQIMPTSTPRKMEAFARSCLFTNPARRPQNAWNLQEEWKELLVELFGKPKFHRFEMPTQPKPPIEIG